MAGLVNRLVAQVKLRLGFSRIMYDAVTWQDIPESAQQVAGYVTGRYAWPAAAWERFAHVPGVRIATEADDDSGDVLDVENGDATPNQARGWAEMRMRAGLARPTIYMSASNWPAVREDCNGLPVDYWVAEWDNRPHSLPGAVAVQFENIRAEGVDLSYVTDRSWPHRTAAPPKVKRRTIVTGGSRNLNETATALGHTPASLLRMSCEHTWNRKFSGKAAAYLNDVFEGRLDPRADVPKGIKLTIAGPAWTGKHQKNAEPWRIHYRYTLKELAAEVKMTPAGILRMTAECSANGVYPTAVASWLNSVFQGKIAPGERLPEGLVFFVRKQKAKR